MEMAAFTIPDKTVQADVLIDEVRKLHVIWEKRTEKTEARLRTLEKKSTEVIRNIKGSLASFVCR